MSDLSRSLVDAAAEAVHARLCGCGQSAVDADQHIETARVAVAAVLEALARSGQVAWAESLQAIADEVKTGEDR